MNIPKDPPNLPPSGRDIQMPDLKAKDTPSSEKAYSKSSLEKRMSSENLGIAIKISNNPDAKAQAPSLIGRVTEGFIDLLRTPFLALGRLLGIVSKEQKEDLSYQVDISEFEEQVKSLENTATEAKNLTSKNRITDSEHKAALETVNRIADVADHQRVAVNLLKLKRSNVGDLFAVDKEKLDQAVKDFRTAIERGESKEKISELLGKVNEAKKRLDTTFEVEQKR